MIYNVAGFAVFFFLFSLCVEQLDLLIHRHIYVLFGVLFSCRLLQC